MCARGRLGKREVGAAITGGGRGVCRGEVTAPKLMRDGESGKTKTQGEASGGRKEPEDWEGG